MKYIQVYLMPYLWTGIVLLSACDDDHASIQPMTTQNSMNQTTTIDREEEYDSYVLEDSLSNSKCGDGICQSSEDSRQCEQDCAYCGDQLCNQRESINTCPLDCSLQQNDDQSISNEVIDMNLMSSSICGDAECAVDEDLSSCPQDCNTSDLQPPIDPNNPPDPNQAIIGHIDGISERNGQWMISGWACHIGWSPSLIVELYAGGSDQTGHYIKRVLAQEDQESAVGEVCGNSEGQHRFTISFTVNELDEYAGQAITMYALSALDQSRHLLTNSGDFRLPGSQPGDVTQPGDLPFDLNQVTWLHTNVSQWPITTTLSVSFQGGTICLDYDKKSSWPSVAIPHSSGMGDVDVVANPWVFIEHENQWYAGTWEWLAINSTCKNISSVAGDHIKRPPFLEMDWRPRSGERLFFMVSALARFSQISNVQERSQIVEVIWP